MRIEDPNEWCKGVQRPGHVRCKTGPLLPEDGCLSEDDVPIGSYGLKRTTAREPADATHPVLCGVAYGCVCEP